MARKFVKEQVTLGLIQMSAGDNPPANLAKATERIETAAKKGAQIVCLQELFRSQYFCQVEDHRFFDHGGLDFQWATRQEERTKLFLSQIL